jgi:hypothetical protein
MRRARLLAVLMDRARSRGGVAIRLTGERWFHVVENHDDLAGHYDDVLETVENPEAVLEGDEGALVAAKRIGAPLALGDSAHFCVGQFRPENDEG